MMEPNCILLVIIGNAIHEYNLSTGFDLSTASFNQEVNLGAYDVEPFGIEFSPDGTRMFIVGTKHNGIDEYVLSTGFDISTATHVCFLSTYSPGDKSIWHSI